MGTPPENAVGIYCAHAHLYAVLSALDPHGVAAIPFRLK